MGRSRRSSRSSRPDVVRLTPWVLGSGGLALGFAAWQLLAPQLRLAGAAQAGLALLLLGGAALLAWAWRRRGQRAAQAPAPRPAQARREFESQLLRAFEAQGYQIVPAGAGGPVDLALRRDRGTWLVHSRQWQADKLGIETLRELQAVVETRGAAGGFVICQGRFSREAQRFAAGSPLRLIDGPALAQLLSS